MLRASNEVPVKRRKSIDPELITMLDSGAWRTNCGGWGPY